MKFSPNFSLLLTATFASTLALAPAQDTPPPADAQPAAAEDAPATDNPKVKLETSKGPIVIELNAEKAPVSVENFLGYVRDGFYDNTVFHRVIKNFMVQGGGFGVADDGTVTQKETGKTIKNEAQNGLKNERGTLAMARTGDPDSATSQFFINVVDNDGLDYPEPDGHGYAVFGKVVEGMDTVDAIKDTPTGMSTLKSRIPSGELLDTPMRDVPTEIITITKATVVEDGGPAAPKAPGDTDPAPGATDPAPDPDAPGEPGATPTEPDASAESEEEAAEETTDAEAPAEDDAAE
ncbi:hypothetical protein BH23VER1_BH23VER1_27580 [soil metagenome]